MSEQDKPFRSVSALSYIAGHTSNLTEFLRGRMKREDWDSVTTEMVVQDPILLANMLRINYEMPENKRIEKAVDEMTHEGMLTLMLGAKRHGKTASAMWLANYLHKLGKKVFWYGYYPALKKYYPWIEQTLNLKKVKGGTLLYDETLLTFMGRDAMTKDAKDKVKTLPIIGHRDSAVIFLSQSFAIDPMIRNLMDFLWFKPLFTMDLFEKQKKYNFSPILKYMMPVRKEENFLINMHTQEPYVFTNPLPDGWNSALSKPFSLIDDIADARVLMDMCFEAGMSQREVSVILEQRGWALNELIGGPQTAANDGGRVPSFPAASPSMQPAKARPVEEGGIQLCPKCGSANFMHWGSRMISGVLKNRNMCSDCGVTWTEKQTVTTR